MGKTFHQDEMKEVWRSSAHGLCSEIRVKKKEKVSFALCRKLFSDEPILGLAVLRDQKVVSMERRKTMSRFEKRERSESFVGGSDLPPQHSFPSSPFLPF